MRVMLAVPLTFKHTPSTVSKGQSTPMGWMSSNVQIVVGVLVAVVLALAVPHV